MISYSGMKHVLTRVSSVLYYYQLKLHFVQKGKSEHRVRACHVSSIATISKVLDTAQNCVQQIGSLYPSLIQLHKRLNFGIATYIQYRSEVQSVR